MIPAAIWPVVRDAAADLVEVAEAAEEFAPALAVPEVLNNNLVRFVGEI